MLLPPPLTLQRPQRIQSRVASRSFVGSVFKSRSSTRKPNVTGFCISRCWDNNELRFCTPPSQYPSIPGFDRFRPPFQARILMINATSKVSIGLKGSMLKMSYPPARSNAPHISMQASPSGDAEYLLVTGELWYRVFKFDANILLVCFGPE